MKSKALFKYIAALLLFGSNGIVAHSISPSSYEIVFTRTLIGSLFLSLIFLSLRQKAESWRNRPHFGSCPHFGWRGVWTVLSQYQLLSLSVVARSPEQPHCHNGP